MRGDLSGFDSKLRSKNSLTNRVPPQVLAVDFDIHNDNAIISQKKISNFSFSQGRGGTLTLGGTSNGDGYLDIKNSAGSSIVTADNTGLTINNGSIVINNTAGSAVVDGQGIVSTQNFEFGQASGTVEFNTTSLTYVDVSNMSLSIPLTRQSNILFGCSATGRRNSTTDSATAFMRMAVDGTIQLGGVGDISGVLTTDGRHNTSCSLNYIGSLAAGTYTLTLQLKAGGTESGQARLVGGTDYEKILHYVILGK